MFGFHIDLYLGMVGSQMALTAGLRLSRLHHGEAVPCVTTGAASSAAVQIDTSHTHIGPGVSTQDTVPDLQNGSVACETTGKALKVAVHSLFQPWIDLPDDLKGIGVLTLGILFGLVRVTTRAILRCHSSSNGHPIFFSAIFQVRALVLLVMFFTHVRIEFLSLVAVITGDVGVGMPAMRPVGKYTGTLLFMTLDAGDSLFGHTSFDPEFFVFGHVLGIRNQ
jgi:hypothetical protein